MKKRGSITVFLSLVLVLLFSFVLTTLEAARIAGGTAYIRMLSVLAGDSFCANYYAPLFEQYGLLGILADDDAGMFSEEGITEVLCQSVVCGTEGMKGGMLRFSEAEARLLSYRTMLTEEGEGFLDQVRKQVVLDGAEQLLFGGITEEEQRDVSWAGTIYKKQEEALRQTATVTEELLELMELVDGIQTTEDGLCTDKNGNLKTTSVFIKQLAAMTETELKECFENEEIYKAVKQGCFLPKERAAEIAVLLQQAMEYEVEIAAYQEEIEECRERQAQIAKQLLKNLPKEEAEALKREREELSIRKKQASEQRDERIEWLDLVLMDAEEQYEKLREKLEAVEPLLTRALKIVEQLEKKQAAAAVSVLAYETFLESVQAEVSEELYRIFEKELEKMKLYIGLEEQGYRISVMNHTLSENRELLQRLHLPGFAETSLEELYRSIRQVEEEMNGYSLEGLWFEYGEIVVAERIEGNGIEVLERLLQTGILSLTGVSASECATGEILGQELPSAGLEAEESVADLLACFTHVSEVFQEEGVLGLLTGVLDASLHTVALELYGREHFGCFRQVEEHTRLSYEREYILHGKETDRANLVQSVLHIAAIRMLFTMTSIIKDPVRMQELEAIAVSVAGFTGIPLLLSATKYSLLLLWSMEEALIETAALLDGKRLPVMSSGGTLSVWEIFVFRDTIVEQKAANIPDHAKGMIYEDYLAVLSLTKGIKRKVYRMMDVIQENMRYRFDDRFRMRNVVTEATFETEAVLLQMVETGIWPKEVYRISNTESVSY